MKKHLLRIFMILLFLDFSSCADDKPKKRTFDRSTLANKNKKVDPSTLMVMQITVANRRDQKTGDIGDFVSYEIIGDADYVQYKICPLETTSQNCPKNETCTADSKCLTNVTPYNRLLLKPLYEGEVEISIRACSTSNKKKDDEQKSGSGNCGIWEKTKHNTHRAHRKLLEKLADESLYEKQIRAAIVARKGRLTKWRQYVDDCAKSNADVEERMRLKIALSDQWLGAPVSFIWGTFTQCGGKDSPLAGSCKSVGRKMSEWMSKSKSTVSNFCIKSFAKMKGEHEGEQGTLTGCMIAGSIAQSFAHMMQAMNPEATLLALNKAIVNLNNPELEVQRACHVEQQLAKDELAYDVEMTRLTQRLSEVRVDLKKLGQKR